jgi:flagellar biosynthesis protein FliQ
VSFWDRFTEELRSIGEVLADWVPRIIIALIILIIGRWLLQLVRKAIERLLNTKPVQTVFDRAGVNAMLAPADSGSAAIAASIIYVVLLVGLWLIVFRVLEIQEIVDLLERLLAWIPLVILAVILVIIAAAAASWTANLVRPFAQERGIPWLTWVVHVGIVLFGVLFAMDVLDVTFAEDITKILIGSAGIAFAVAFGVGGIDTAKKWWARYLAPRDTGPAAHTPVDRNI